MVEFENGHPCGYLIHGNGDPWMKIYQACIQYDARRREHGLELVKRLFYKACFLGRKGISLWCATDLDANEFWRDAGFHLVGTRAGGERRHRVHNLWVKVGVPLL